MIANRSTTKDHAYIIKADDGGYVLLNLPSNASHKVFENVLWSNENTCQSQNYSN